MEIKILNQLALLSLRHSRKLDHQTSGSFDDRVDLSAAPAAEGAAIDVHVFAEAVESKAVAEFFREGLKDKPVATARIIAKDGEEPPIVVIARADAIEALTASEERGGAFKACSSFCPTQSTKKYLRLLPSEIRFVIFLTVAPIRQE